MQASIHPKNYPDAQVICVCGNKFTVGSTQPEIRVDICSNCHPFYTGEQRFVDVQGRVEKFQAKMKAATVQPVSKKVNARSVKPQEALSLKDMLKGATTAR